MKWTAREIARALYVHAFDRKHLVCIPNCHFPGSECDVFVVRSDLRTMEVEVKISRNDLKADASKGKWFDSWEWRVGEPWIEPKLRPAPTPRTHPRKIWKHYYAMPEAIWAPELAEFIQPASGVILLRDSKTQPFARVERQAKPNKDATKVSAEDMVYLARLSTVRMWESYHEVDSHRRQQEKREPLAEELVMHAGDLR